MNEAELARANDTLGDWRWRLSNLYYITDKNGRRVKFQMNWAQEHLFNNMHYMNVILKARQLGFTTFFQLFMLDACLFNSNVRAGTVAHNQNDAKAIFNDKVKFPYDNLPDKLKELRLPKRDSAFELAFSNNSSVRVGTSLRSGTLNYLHISEYGKLCAKRPEQAREVRTGALNTVQAGQVVTIESTAEGQEGDFYRVCDEGQTNARMGTKLTPLDWKFFFFPWWQAPEYWLEPEGVPIPAVYRAYFGKLVKNHGIRLNAGQQAWYVKKAASQLDDMKREYPSTPKEAFEATVEGAFYGDPIAALELQGRVCKVEAEPNFPVHTAWDIGRSDYTSIWFWQRFYNEVRLVGYLQNSGEGLPWYAKEVKELYEANKWSRNGAVDWLPHDVRVIEWGSNLSRVEQMVSAGLNPHIATKLGLHDGINAVRAILPQCVFDEAGCADGLKALKAYRKTWMEERGAWSDEPYHNWASHASDAFRYLACATRENKEQQGPAKPASAVGTYGDMIKQQIRAARGSQRR